MAGARRGGELQWGGAWLQDGAFACGHPLPPLACGCTTVAGPQGPGGDAATRAATAAGPGHGDGAAAAAARAAATATTRPRLRAVDLSKVVGQRGRLRFVSFLSRFAAGVSASIETYVSSSSWPLAAFSESKGLDDAW
ncbi:hypothetical protein EJB05_19056, partial [Eragrostis curvula]